MFPKASKSKAVALVLAALFCLMAAAIQASESKPVLKVMTRNMDAGTDLNLIFAYYPNVRAGGSATLAQVISTDIPSRVQRLADEIRTNQPDFIALQEVTEWRTGACGATAVLYDQLQLLLDALADLNMPYTTLAADTLNVVEAPSLTGCVRYIDGNAILVRSGLKSGIEVSNVQAHHYSTDRGLASLGRSISKIPPVSLLFRMSAST